MPTKPTPSVATRSWRRLGGKLASICLLYLCGVFVAPGQTSGAITNFASSRPPPELLHVAEINRLSREEQAQGRPVRLGGVVTEVLRELHAFVFQDDTGSIYVRDVVRTNPLPQLGERLELRGQTDKGDIVLRGAQSLGRDELPARAMPASGEELMNGSLDMQRVEIRGVVEGLLNRRNGWSRVDLRTRDGTLKVELRRAGVTPGPLEQYEGAVIRLRGMLFVDRYPNGRVKVGQIRMHDATIIVEQPALADVFSLPAVSAAALVRSDPDYNPFRRVKVAGQIVFVRGYDHFLMDGQDGLRFVTSQTSELSPGDLVEVVGYPEMSAAAPVLRSAVVRKTGHAPLPSPIPLSSDDLIRPGFDATLVSVEGKLASVRDTETSLIMEIQSGSWRFLARLKGGKVAMRVPEIGSQLRLTGVYCAQGGYKALGEDVAAVDLLLISSAGIEVLATPSWWTLPRLLVVAGVLAFLLLAALLWVTLLRRRVEQRTGELQAQIHERERVEHLRALEQERARIAHELHDELGADITEIGMLAARVRTEASPVAERSRCLAQLTEKTGQMVAALEEIVWAMNPQHDSAASVVSYFSFYADRFLGLANLRLQLEAAPGTPDIAVDARVRHQLFLVFKEALANIVNHARATEVRISLRIEPGEFCLTVADNGRGLPATAAAPGQDGLGNMRARIEGLRGQFELTSANGCGTELKFHVPLS